MQTRHSATLSNGSSHRSETLWPSPKSLGDPEASFYMTPSGFGWLWGQASRDFLGLRWAAAVSFLAIMAIAGN